MTHIVKGFSIVNETEVCFLFFLFFFLEFSCFCYDLVNVGDLISSTSDISKLSLNIWKFSVHIMLKPSSEDCEHNLTNMGDEYNCLVV